jgi:DNA adenine methylase
MAKTTVKKLRPPIKTHGGKYYLSNWVIDNFPKNYTELNYCEPFCGGASVFLNKDPSDHETIADIDKGVISVFKALRDEPKEFIGKLKRIKYTEATFNRHLKRAGTEFDDYVDHAVNEFVLRRMSRGGLKNSFAWSDRIRGGKPGDVNAWETILEMLPHIAERVKRCTIICAPFDKVVKNWDEENVFTYLDPPYMHSTRNESAIDAYQYEMTVEDHIRLLNMIKSARGKIMISGYHSPLYKKTLVGWKCKKKEIANHSGQSKSKERRLECIWMNY